MQLSKIHVFSFKTTRVKYKIHLNQIDNSIEGGHYLKYFTHPFIMSQARASSLIARAESSIRFSHRQEMDCANSGEGDVNLNSTIFSPKQNYVYEYNLTMYPWNHLNIPLSHEYNVFTYFQGFLTTCVTENTPLLDV